MIHQERGAAITKEMADQFQKIFREQTHDALHTGAEYFSYADFLGALFGNKCSQSE